MGFLLTPNTASPRKPNNQTFVDKLVFVNVPIQKRPTQLQAPPRALQDADQHSRRTQVSRYPQDRRPFALRRLKHCAPLCENSTLSQNRVSGCCDILLSIWDPKLQTSRRNAPAEILRMCENGRLTGVSEICKCSSQY